MLNKLTNQNEKRNLNARPPKRRASFLQDAARPHPFSCFLFIQSSSTPPLSPSHPVVVFPSFFIHSPFSFHITVYFVYFFFGFLLYLVFSFLLFISYTLISAHSSPRGSMQTPGQTSTAHDAPLSEADGKSWSSPSKEGGEHNVSFIIMMMPYKSQPTQGRRT